eukprot:SAG22_NODE_9033_length_613_cov_2.177043_2_plen_69_part_01
MEALGNYTLDEEDAEKKSDDVGNRRKFVRATRGLPACTDQHVRMLYLVALHARCALNSREQEQWIRRT